MIESLAFLLVVSLIILAIPMIYSLIYFILERQRSFSKNSYLRFTFLFPIFYVLFFVLFYYLSSFIDFFNSITKKYLSYELNDLPKDLYIILLFIIIPITYAIFYIKIMKKYLSFNDINLFFIFKIILSFIIFIILIKLHKEVDPYLFLIYLIVFTSLCWILFFINIFVQNKNSRKRKSQSDANHSEIDEKEEGQ